MQRTPLPPEAVDIVEFFGMLGSYAQTSAQSIFPDLGAACFFAFAAMLAIIFIAGQVWDGRTRR